MIDLHTHTTASDGTLTPGELVAAACEAGLSAVGITDHDTCDGVPEALAAGRRLGLRVVPGIEISARFTGGTLHLLGYGIDPARPAFAAGIERLKTARAERNPKIIANLQAMGISITLEQVAARAGSDVIGRPHIAETLCAAGAAEDLDDAFDRYVGVDAPAYEPKLKYEPARAFELIRSGGGIPVLAHPCQTGRAGEALRRFVTELAAEGLEGIEVLYPSHTPEQSRFYDELAAEFDLVRTGGSDFHGTRKPDLSLGIGTGDLHVPDEWLDKLDTRIAARFSQDAD